MDEHLRSVLWQRLDLPGGEYCALWRVKGGWQLTGVAVASFAGKPLRAEYTVECDEAWRALEAVLVVVQGAEKRSLQLYSESDGTWELNDVPTEDLRGCVDIDLSLTPATNTLPIRRLKLAVGASAEVVAAWVRFPELTVEPLWQRYTRLSADRYRYESGGGFTTELVVDDLGLLIDYETGWRRISA